MTNAPPTTRYSRKKLSRKRIAAEAVFKRLGFLERLFFRSNNALQIARYEIVDAKIPASFDEYLLAQVSDLHGKLFEPRNEPLLAALHEARPDAILVTGDLFDERHTNDLEAREFLERAKEVAPVYYITGNHESNLDYASAAKALALVEASGAIFLDGKVCELSPRGNGDDRIRLYGVADPPCEEDFFEGVDARLDALEGTRDRSRFEILLAHRPEGIARYAARGYDLVFSGHAHGGQFRFPLLCPEGLFAPGQGWFPRYTAGIHEIGKTREIISRGLGSSVIPTRLFNRPELVLCALRSRKDICQR